MKLVCRHSKPSEDHRGLPKAVALAQAVSAQTPLHCKFHLGRVEVNLISHSVVVSCCVIGVA